MGAVTTLYQRVSSVTGSSNATTRLLSPGTQGTNYKGLLQALPLSPTIGDMIRIHAWGTLVNTSTTTHGSCNFKIYFNTGNPATLQNPIFDTSDSLIKLLLSTTRCWHLHAWITFTAVGANGTGICSGLFECLDQTLGATNMNLTAMSLPTTFNMDTTVNNYLDMTVEIPNNPDSSVVLYQCSIEQMGSP